MPGYTEDMGAAIIPANTASATPTANTTRYSSVMLMPSDCTISRLVAPARTIIPSRVLLISRYMPSASSKHTPETNSR